MADSKVKVFEWAPHVSKTVTSNYRVRSAVFGDGYEQTTGDGINTKSKSLSVEFIGDKEKIDAIQAFFDAHDGFKAFEFRGELYRVEGYTLKQVGPYVFSVSTTFKQAHHA